MLIFETIFAKQQADARAAVLATPETVAKMAKRDVGKIIKAIDTGAVKAAKPEIEGALRAMASDQAIRAAATVARARGITGAEYERMLTQANERAIEWAADAAGELITEISRTTRKDVRELLTNAIAAGSTNDEIAAMLSESFPFSRERSLLIARTETAFAEQRGTLEGWDASGEVVGKAVLPDVDPCPVCQANADQGTIPIDALFLSGDPAPPFHPRCECSMTAVLRDE